MLRSDGQNPCLHRPIVQAVQLVKTYLHSPRPTYPEEESIPIKDIVKAKWRDLVVERDADGTERVNRLNYEVCVLEALREKVRTKEIWVLGAKRFSNPDDDLPTDFETKREAYYQALKQPTAAQAFTDQIQAAMRSALQSLNTTLPRLEHRSGISARN